MKILVTGGAGYIGSVLVEELLRWLSPARLFELTVLDNFMYGQTSLAHLCYDTRLKIIRGDVRDYDLLNGLAKESDVVIPLAALVGAPLCEQRPADAWEINVEAIQTMVRQLKSNTKLIIPISNSGYGIGQPGELCTEESPLQPVSLYGKSKVAAEAAALIHPNTVSLRLATVFGMSPRMRMDLLVNDFVWRAVTDRSVVLFEADFKRNYIHIRGVAHTFIHALSKWGQMKGNIYNVGLSSANLSKRQLCEEIRKVVPDFHAVEAPLGKDPDKRDYIISNAKLEATGWVPGYSLAYGIAELVKGYQMLRKVQFGNV